MLEPEGVDSIETTNFPFPRAVSHPLPLEPSNPR